MHTDNLESKTTSELMNHPEVLNEYRVFLKWDVLRGLAGAMLRGLFVWERVTVYTSTKGVRKAYLRIVGERTGKVWYENRSPVSQEMIRRLDKASLEITNWPDKAPEKEKEP